MLKTQRHVSYEILILYGGQMMWDEYLNLLYYYAEQAEIDDSDALEVAVM